MDLDEAGDFGAQVRVAFNDLGDAGQELFDLAVEMAQMQLQRSQRFGTGGLLDSVFLAGAIFAPIGRAG